MNFSSSHIVGSPRLAAFVRVTSVIAPSVASLNRPVTRAALSFDRIQRCNSKKKKTRHFIFFQILIENLIGALPSGFFCFFFFLNNFGLVGLYNIFLRASVAPSIHPFLVCFIFILCVCGWDVAEGDGRLLFGFICRTRSWQNESHDPRGSPSSAASFVHGSSAHSLWPPSAAAADAQCWRPQQRQQQ